MFSEPEAVADYALRPARIVPGFADMQRMAAVLLDEAAGHDGHILVLGAGGGLELRTFAAFAPGWRFTGVDPAQAMLDLARQTIGPEGAARVDLRHGYIDTAPMGPFDGATCLLTLHFVPLEARLPTLQALRLRLRPGARLVVAHLSVPDPARDLWLGRYAAYAMAAGGISATQARAAAAKIATDLTVLSPAADEALLHDAGFVDVSLFYAGLAFRGWVATAP